MILRPRALVVASSLFVAICLVLVVAARKAAPMTPTSDTAVIELDTLLASRGQLLVGPYSRFQWHHPGPLYFIWMAPFYLLACLLVVTSLLALWAATRIEGAIFDHEVFWIAGVGALNLSLLPALVGARLSDKVPETSSTRTMLTAACWLIVSLSAIAGVRHFREAVVHSANPGIESETARLVADDLSSYLTRESLVRPLVRIDQDAWGMAAGVILKLYKDGFPVAVEDDWLVMFAPAFKAGGRESAVITIAGKAQHVRMEGTPGDELIVTRDPLFVHRSR